MKCILCSKKKFKKLFEVEGYEIIKCIKCGLVKTGKGKSKNKISYNNYHRDKDYKENEKMFKNIFKKRYNLIKKHIQKGKILEIGSSTGTLLQIFKKNGWEAWGIEPSASAIKAKKRGIKTIKETFEKARLPKKYFDVVVLNHTLEHLEDPLTTLKRVKTILKKEGVVYIDVPNFESLASKIQSKKWKYILPNEHVHHFTPKTLETLLKKAGFRVAWLKTWSGLFDYSNPFLDALQALRGKKKRFFINLYTFPFSFLSTILSKGTSMGAIGVN